MDGEMPGNMQGMLAQAQQMQQQMAAAQEELANSEVTGTAGGGTVTATVSGTGELSALNITPEVVDPQDTETLADLIVAAVRDANSNAQQLAEDKLGPVTGGLGDLGGMLGLPGT